MNRKSLGWFTLASLVPLCGCQSLAGTKWVASEIKIKAQADSRNAAEIQAMIVEFGGDGTLKTMVQRADGSVRIEDSETYEVQGDKIRIKHPNYEKQVSFQLRDGALLIQSEQYDLTFAPYVRSQQTSSSQDAAMFRPTDLRQPEYRRVTYSKR